MPSKFSTRDSANSVERLEQTTVADKLMEYIQKTAKNNAALQGQWQGLQQVQGLQQTTNSGYAYGYQQQLQQQQGIYSGVSDLYSPPLPPIPPPTPFIVAPTVDLGKVMKAIDKVLDRLDDLESTLEFLQEQVEELKTDEK